MRGDLQGMAFVQLPVEMPLHILREHIRQRTGDAFHAPGVGELHRRFPVGVRAHFGRGLHHAVERSEAVIYRNAVRKRARFDKVPLPLGEGAGDRVLLQDDKIAAHLRSGMVGKEVVRQPHGCDQIAPLHQPFPHGFVAFRIGHTLRSDEGDEAPVAHQIDRLHKEIVVYRPCTLSAYRIARIRKRRIEQRNVPERDIARNQVEVPLVGGFYGFEALHPHRIVGIEPAQDQSRHRVFLEAGDLGLFVITAQVLRESPRPGARFECTHRNDARIIEHPRNGVRHGFRCVEGRQHRSFEAVQIAFVLALAAGVLFQHGVQLFDQGRERRFLFVRQRFQYLFDRSEAAVRTQHIPFFGRSRPLFPLQREGRADRFDIAAQVFGLIVCHCRAGFERFP